MDYYRGFGLMLAIASTLLAIFTFYMLGLHPLLALWIGLFSVGLTMLVTPTSVRGLSELNFILEASMENIGRLLESLNLRSHAIYIPRGDTVYIVVYGGSKVKSIPNVDLDKFMTFIDGAPVVVLRSPVDVKIEGGDVCSVIDEVIDKLELAESTLCRESAGGVIVEFRGVRSKAGYGVAGVGSIYSAITATLVAKLYRAPVEVKSENWSDGRVTIVVEVSGVGEELHS